MLCFLHYNFTRFGNNNQEEVVKFQWFLSGMSLFISGYEISAGSHESINYMRQAFLFSDEKEE